jgi:hypothetical protein
MHDHYLILKLGQALPSNYIPECLGAFPLLFYHPTSYTKQPGWYILTENFKYMLLVIADYWACIPLLT